MGDGTALKAYQPWWHVNQSCSGRFLIKLPRPSIGPNMFNLIGENSDALQAAYSDHGNEYVLLVNAPLLIVAP
jgi:hypothetical protein